MHAGMFCVCSEEWATKPVFNWSALSDAFLYTHECAIYLEQ